MCVAIFSDVRENLTTLAAVQKQTMDGDPLAKCGLLSWESDWAVQHRRAAYDAEQEIENLNPMKSPQWKKFSHQLQKVKLG